MVTFRVAFFILVIFIVAGCSSSESNDPPLVVDELCSETSIMLIGDSITARMPKVAPQEGVSIDNQAVCSNFVFDEKDKFKGRLTYIPNVIIIMLGINDISQTCLGLWDYTFEDIQVFYDQMLDVMQGKCPHAKIYIQSILPIEKEIDGANPMINDLNNWLEAVCETRGLTFINHHDLFLDENGKMSLEYTEDGVHPNAAGYDVLMNSLSPYLTMP